MATSKPIHCRPVAYQLFKGQLGKLDTMDGLVGAAVAISAHELDQVDLVAVNQKLQTLAGRVRSRVRRQSSHALLAHMHDVLFDVEGFTGAADDYYNPANSYLPVVLETKRGIPISLTLVYKAVAERLGLHVKGIAAPGHFLAAVEEQGTWMLVDPFFGGRVLTRNEALSQVRSVIGDEEVPLEGLLPEASPRQWLARMLHNLQAIFTQQHRRDDVTAMQELQSLL